MEMTTAEQVKQQIAELSAALQASHPQMPTLLRTIHSSLKQDPELVTALSEEEICAIVTGLKKHTQLELVSATMAKKGKSMKSMSVADL